MSYGKITIGYGTTEQKDLSVIDFVKCLFPGDRVVHVAMIEDGSFSVTIENLQSSGRSPQQTMRLSKESLVAIHTGIQMYFGVKGEDPVKLLTEFMQGNPIEYTCSDNLDPKFKL
jgi:hypothetical protein